MSPQERASVVGLFTGLLLNTYVLVRLWQLFSGDELSGIDGPMIWARAIVWVIPAAIAISVVSHVVFTVAGRSSEQRNIVDERDQLFQFRGTGVLIISVAIGFMGMIIALALGVPAVIGLTIMYASVAIGDIIGNAVRIASYRIGG